MYNKKMHEIKSDKTEIMHVEWSQLNKTSNFSKAHETHNSLSSSYSQVVLI